MDMFGYGRRSFWSGVALMAIGLQVSAAAAAVPEQGAWLSGIYRAVPEQGPSSSGLRARGSPEDVDVVADFRKTDAQEHDPLNECMPIGPFRMMARPDIRMEFVRQKGRLMMLFEELALGHMRVVHFDRPHRTGAVPTWQGDTVGRWDRDVLTLETANFNDRTWLNSAGMRHSDALRLVETLRPLKGGDVIEYTMQATDPKAMQRPYVYTRYFFKDNPEFRDVACVQRYAAAGSQ
ncbi:MAG: hypothetical protein QM696_14365 [Steroidobacteraceae bacterium]